MKKTIITMIMVLSLALISMAQATTIATFSDPSPNGATPMFKVDTASHTMTALWNDSHNNLNLQVVVDSAAYANAWFEMTPVSFTGSLTGGETSGGTINFYADNTTGNPLVTIAFEKANLSLNGFGALDFLRADGVTIGGSAISNPLTDESFAFSFSNHALSADGSYYTATAAFTSSATVVPEPATLTLMTLAGLSLLRRRRVSRQPA